MNPPRLTAADRALEDIREGRWQSALRNADLALAEGSTEAWLPRLRGVALTNMGRLDEATGILETVAEQDPSPVILHELAAARIAGNDMLGARRAVNRAIAVDAIAPHTRRAAALLAMRNDDWVGAETDLRAVVMEDQFDIEALNNLAICLVQQGRSGEAMQFMGHARSRGQSTRHWQLLDHNYELLVSSRHPGDDDGAPLQTAASREDTPRPSMAAAMIRAGYEARKNPQATRPPQMSRGFYRVMVTLLVLAVLVTLVGASVKEPPLGAVAVIVIAVFGVLRWRTRPGRHLTALPTSARVRTAARRPRSERSGAESP